jgi:hypothetical protein
MGNYEDSEYPSLRKTRKEKKLKRKKRVYKKGGKYRTVKLK